MKELTISDIAKRAGVSKATVSRVLNSPEQVKEKTRAKVQKIIEATHYTPSATARNLSKQVSSTIGVIVPEIANPFFGDLFSGIEEILSENNFSLLYSNNADDIDKDFESLNMMKTQRVMGILYVPAVNYQAIGMMDQIDKKLDGMGCPTVCIDRDIHLNVDTIHFNDRLATKNAVLALTNAGHRQIAFINGNARKNILASERYEGYLEGIKEAGYSPSESLIFHGEYDDNYAYEVTKALIARQTPPSAIITCNNSLGKGYLKAVYENNKQHLFTHIGLDKIEMLDLLKIPNNFILRDSYQMGKKAAELLISRISCPDSDIQNIALETSLVRETF